MTATTLTLRHEPAKLKEQAVQDMMASFGRLGVSFASMTRRSLVRDLDLLERMRQGLDLRMFGQLSRTAFGSHSIQCLSAVLARLTTGVWKP